MRTNIFCCLSALLLALQISAQEKEAKSEFEKMRQFFSGPSLKHIAGQMLLKEIKTGAAVDKVDFDFWVKEKKAFSRMNYIEMLNNGSVYVMVNHQRKTILARQTKGKSTMPLQMSFDVAQIELLLKKGVQVKIDLKGETKQMTLTQLNDPRFVSIILYYSARDYRISKVEARLQPEPGAAAKMLEVQYQTLEQLPASEEDAVFNASKYIAAIKSGTIQYTKAYQAYTKL